MNKWLLLGMLYGLSLLFGGFYLIHVGLIDWTYGEWWHAPLLIASLFAAVVSWASVMVFAVDTRRYPCGPEKQIK